jgi:molecular chaperone GrpE
MADKTKEKDPVEMEDHLQDGDAAGVTATADDTIKKLQSERDALYDRLARQQAEFENLRKRTEREKQDFREYAVADTLRSLLPILDNFHLALRVQGSNDDLRKGVELIRKQMEDTLTKLGLQPVPALGEPFDPRMHEAIEVVESADAEDNHVLEELQTGYKFKERLLRPSMVRVARNSQKQNS